MQKSSQRPKNEEIIEFNENQKFDKKNWKI